jgi:hypothetical protein
MTSSRLCKYAEGAVFPFQVESLEDGVDDSVHGFDVDEADHGACSLPDFDETAFDDVGSTQLAPQVFGETEESQQFGQIAFHLPHHAGVERTLAAAKGAGSSLRWTKSIGEIDGLSTGLDGVVVVLADLVEDVAHLVHPAALMGHPG